MNISITRNGVEIPLTAEEIEKIYRYKRHKYNIEDIEIVLDDLAEAGDDYDGDEIRLVRNHLDEAAAEYEDILSNSDDWVYAAKAAINIVIRDYKTE